MWRGVAYYLPYSVVWTTPSSDVVRLSIPLLMLVMGVLARHGVGWRVRAGACRLDRTILLLLLHA